MKIKFEIIKEEQKNILSINYGAKNTKIVLEEEGDQHLNELFDFMIEHIDVLEIERPSVEVIKMNGVIGMAVDAIIESISEELKSIRIEKSKFKLEDLILPA